MSMYRINSYGNGWVIVDCKMRKVIGFAGTIQAAIEMLPKEHRC